MQFVYVVRHGETDANVNKQVNDKNMNTPLNATGKKQATKTGKYFKTKRCPKAGSKDGCIIYSSPSIRAVQTAELIAKELKIDKKDIIQDDRIHEMDHGMLSGSTKNDKIQKAFMKDFNKLPTDAIDLELAFLKFDIMVAKKYKMETAEQIEARVQSFYDALPKNKKNIIVVTHGGLVQFTIRTLFNLRPEIRGDLTNGKNCHITGILREHVLGVPKYTLLTLPNTVHLK